MSKRVCNVDGCDRPITARGMCRKHYLREYRAGSHLEVPTRSTPTCPPNHAHDLDGCYLEHGCRCRVCRHLRAMDRQRRRNRLRAYGRGVQVAVRRVSATPVREHVAQLHAQGFGIERIGQAAGVGHGPIMDLWYGPRGRKRERVADLTPTEELATRTVNAAHADRLLALTAEDIEGAFVDPTGTLRRLQALVAIGYPETVLAGMLGMHVGNLWTLIHGRRRRITSGTCDAVEALFRELWDKPQIGARADYARRIAKRYRWVSSLAWDDIDDPTEQPDGIARVRDARYTASEYLDDVEFLLELGEAPHQIVATIGKSFAAIEKAAERHGRGDLVPIFVAARLGREVAA